MNHIAFGVPVLVLAVAIYLDELLEDGSLATIAALSEAGGVVVVAVDVGIMLVIAVLGAENSIAHGTRKVIDVVFSIQSSNVGASQGASTLVAEKAESSKIVGFAKRILALTITVVRREEFGGYYLSTILEIVRTC